MSTISKLLADGRLVRYEAALVVGQLPERCVYLSNQCAEELSELEGVDHRGRGKLTPFEQVDEILTRFVRGRPMAYDVERKCLDPVGLAVWELKTRDVRLFGWFASKGVFIGVCVDLKENLTENSCYKKYIELVCKFREKNKVTKSEVVRGVGADDVL